MTAGPGQTLFEFIRYWSRRSVLGRPGAAEARLALVAEAVAALIRRGISPSVGSVAEELGLDRSGASRLVTAATGAGYLRARRAGGDARRRELKITAAGDALLLQAHAWQEDVFRKLTDGWTDARRERLGRDLRDLILRSSDRTTAQEDS